jgi:hypothetical protein
MHAIDEALIHKIQCMSPKKDIRTIQKTISKNQSIIQCNNVSIIKMAGQIIVFASISYKKVLTAYSMT